MVELPHVTLVCIDTANHPLALRALARSSSDIRFARALLLTDELPAGLTPPAGVEVIAIPPLTSRDAYSQFVLKGLLPFVATSHALLVQWDGYVVNASAWTPDFLRFDYIGAAWFWRDDGMRVGNGGFSLRSRRLLDALQDPRIVLDAAEDITICRTFRPLLEREHGIRFADEATAARLSFEADYPAGEPFGFHGLFNFHRVVPPAELRTLPALFSDAIARSPQSDQLMHNCLVAGMWAQGAAIARRILAADPGNREVEAILADIEPRIDRADMDRPPRPWTADEHTARGDRFASMGDSVSAAREYRAARALRSDASG